MPDAGTDLNAADRRALRASLMPSAVVGLVFLLIGVGVAISNATASSQRSELASTGVRTTATIVEQHVGAFGADSYVVVAYNVGGIARRAEIQVDIPASKDIDKPLDIAYDPADPSRIDLAQGGGSRAVLIWAGMFIVFGLGAAGYAALWYALCLRATKGRSVTAATATAYWRPWGRFGQTWLEVESPALLQAFYVRVPGRSVRTPFDDEAVRVVGDIRAGNLVLVKLDDTSIWPSGRVTHERPGNLRLR